jgi:hypothetical protein
MRSEGNESTVRRPHGIQFSVIAPSELPLMAPVRAHDPEIPVFMRRGSNEQNTAPVWRHGGSELIERAAR